MNPNNRRPPLLVIGHRNPDTDAICSAIGESALLRMTGQNDAQAVRCGDIPERAAWVLERAKVPVPPLVTDVRITAGAVCRREVVQVSASDTFLNAYRRMLASGVRSAPVVDDDGKVSGILRYLDLLELLVPMETEGLAVRTVHVSLGKIRATLQGESVGAALPEEAVEEDLVLFVGASSIDTVEQRLETAAKNGTAGHFLVMCGDRPHVQRLAIERGARALIVTGGFGIDPELRTLARDRGIVVLLCSQDTASCATLIRCSRTVRRVIHGECLTVGSAEVVSRLRKRLAPVPQDIFPVMDERSGRMIGVLSKSDLIDPPRTRLVLVDHNEFAQAVTGVEEAEIVEVIDHHRLAGDLVSREPIRFLNEPVGSTSTLIARKFLHRNLVPDPGVAMCLCAGIISDTLHLTSPTTSDLDREMLDWLGRVAGIDPQTFSTEFFAVGSVLLNGEPEAVLNADRKEFGDEGLRISISQVEELGLHAFDRRRDELERALCHLMEQGGYEIACLVVTDIPTGSSLLLAAGPGPFLKSLPFRRLDATLFEAPGVVSRKKQIFPAICQAIRRAGAFETIGS